MALIPISDESLLKEHGIYFKSTTLRTWFNKGRYPHVFKKVMGRIYIDLKKWETLVETQTQFRGC